MLVMKHLRQMAVCLVIGVAGCTLVRAADIHSYATIPARNVFGLVPIPPPICDCAPPPAVLPPKITVDGLMTVFGRPQALFKTMTQKDSLDRKSREDVYVLSEGEQEDEIQVVHIDMATQMVTFDNKGTLQQIPLANRK
jgi:hypothetical protein